MALSFIALFAESVARARTGQDDVLPSSLTQLWKLDFQFVAVFAIGALKETRDPVFDFHWIPNGLILSCDRLHRVKICFSCVILAVTIGFVSSDSLGCLLP